LLAQELMDPKSARICQTTGGGAATTRVRLTVATAPE